jgi:hypothetical protein
MPHAVAASLAPWRAAIAEPRTAARAARTAAGVRSAGRKKVEPLFSRIYPRNPELSRQPHKTANPRFPESTP